MKDIIEIIESNEELLGSTKENLIAWLEGDFLPSWALQSLEELVEQEAWSELNDRFYKYIAFGTGGMRGRTIGNIMTGSEEGTLSSQGTPSHPAVGTAVLNDFNIIRATMGLFRYCSKYLQDNEIFDVPKLVIAHDVRHFSRHFCELAASTWCRLGGYAMIFEGPRSTPQLSFSVRHLKATAGIVITASHNPPHDNGYKVYFSDGAQVVSPHDQGIIKEVYAIELDTVKEHLDVDMNPVITLPGTVDDAYLDALDENILDEDALKDSGAKVIFTPIHGTGAVMSIPALKKYGIDVEEVEEQSIMDPGFPTVKSPNPENAEALSLGIEKAEEVDADAVLATDPDCDRMGVAVRSEADEMVLLTGNMIGSLLAEYRIRQHKALNLLDEESIENSVLIKTFVTTPLQAKIAEKHGLKVINTLTGFKFIGDKLKDYEDKLKADFFDDGGIALNYDETDRLTRMGLLLEYSTYYVFGGEESYGYLSSDKVRDKDANAAVIMFCEMIGYLKKSGKTVTQFLDEIYLTYGYHLEQLLNIVYEGAAGAQKIQNILNSYREFPPTELNGIEITKFTDFGRQDIYDADGKLIPKQDFFLLELANGYSYAVRGSGTEPKIKFYLFACEDVINAEDLPLIKAETEVHLNDLKAAIDEDARHRADG